MKRFASLLLTLTLAAAPACPVRATGNTEIIRTFVYDGTLYTYMRLEDMDQPITRAAAKIGAQVFPASTRLETVRQARSPVTWPLLVDNSTSMPIFRDEVNEFAESLAASSGENTHFILSTFGDAFAVVSENISPDDLTEASGGLHQVIGETSPEKAGDALTSFGDNFDVTEFDLSGCTAPAGETAVRAEETVKAWLFPFPPTGAARPG